MRDNSTVSQDKISFNVYDLLHYNIISITLWYNLISIMIFVML